MSEINLESKGLDGNISDFGSQMKEMENLLLDIRNNTKNIDEYYAGDDSEIVKSVTSEFINKFDLIEEKNKNYKQFLENVIIDYKKKDDEISSDALK